ncbi:antibiotic biosynthesis monooxygenase [Nocardia sp. NPDC020380]|uniref:antibiotic biosynthesis monooxygenase n=1 Tax=Nocardia sp. NPDC020380 TaxID=3364309 RepID=UPI0037B4BA2D
MPIIRVDGTVTQINVFTVNPGQQQALLDYLAAAARVAADVPGWMSASLHRSLDGTKVVNYAQSEDMDASRRVIDRLMAEGMIQGNKAFGQSKPGLYEVTFTLDRDSRPAQ